MTARTEVQTRISEFDQVWRSLAGNRIWPLALLAIGTASNLIFAHVPLVAVAVASGVTLKRKWALATALIIWLVNQVIGFGWRGYPFTLVALTWGILMGFGTLLVTMAASWRPSFSRSSWIGHWLWLAIATLVGFMLYQGMILLAFPWLAGGHTMDWDIVGKLFLKQVTWVGAIAIGHSILLWCKSVSSAST